MRSALTGLMLAACLTAPALAKLPPLSDEAKAKAAETATKTAWSDKVGAYQLCRVVLGKRSLRDLPLEVAVPLYLGLATDTGWFKHSNVKPNVMETAAALLATGVDHAGLYVNIEQRERLPRLKLLARALASLELHDQNRVAVMSLTKKDFADTGAQPADAGGFAKAALRLNSSPPAVTRAISGLEARLGVEIFARTTRSVHLTEAGRVRAERSRLVLPNRSSAPSPLLCSMEIAR